MTPLVLGLHGEISDRPAREVHDAAYCLADPGSGEILSLLEMEKITGIRHDGRLDRTLLERELARLEGSPLEAVSSHFTTSGDAPRRPLPHVDVRGLDRDDLGCLERREIQLGGRTVPHRVHLHELAHVMSAFMYRRAEDERFLGLVVEGCGSFAQNSVFLVEGRRIRLLEWNLPILSGHFFHQWLSRLVFDAGRLDRRARSATAGKAMALAAHGDPERFRPEILAAAGRYRAGEYMNYREGFCPAIEGLELTFRDRADLCASGQRVFEELLLREAVRLAEAHRGVPLYYAGGCALSIKANSALLEALGDVTIPPCCGDIGIALGLVALDLFLERGIRLAPLDARAGLASPARPDLVLEGTLTDADVEEVARWLAEGEVVAFAQGAPEIGPRALCRRSILGDPGRPGMRDVLNHMKGREYFRPVAPVVLDPAGEDLFLGYRPSPFMLFEHRPRAERAAAIREAVHADGTARTQSVPDDGSDIARILRAFARRTGGPPLLLNTSLNSRARAIAATEEQVKEELSRLAIRHAVLGGSLYHGRSRERAVKATGESGLPRMAAIPGGPFRMGAPDGDREALPHERPIRTVELSPYQLSVVPVTNRQYLAFTRATGHPEPRHWRNRPPGGEEAEHPVSFVSWLDATAYAEWLSALSGEAHRLPTEAEWEKAARGSLDLGNPFPERRYPHGDEIGEGEANFAGLFAGTTPVGSFPRGASPYGCQDMAGNVSEWCLDTYRPDAYAVLPAVDPRAGGEGPRVVRGGSWRSEASHVRCSNRYSYPAEASSYGIGFRVARVEPRYRSMATMATVSDGAG